MSIKNLPDELIVCILKFLPSNKDTYSLIRTNQQFYQVGKRYGFLKHIRCKVQKTTSKKSKEYDDTPTWNVLPKLHKHTLCTLTLNGLPRDLSSICWVKNMCFKDCGYPDIFSSLSSPVCTEYLYVYSMIFILNGKTFNINWNCFPKLKKVVMNVHKLGNVDFSPLINLEFLFIRTYKGDYIKNKEEPQVVFFGIDEPLKPIYPVQEIHNTVSRMN